MRIGELSRRSGLSQDTLRYYERLGLLSPSRSGPGDYRQYSMRDVERCALIKFAQQLGYRLEEIASLATAWDAGRMDRAAKVEALATRIAAIDAQLERLQAVRGYLAAKRDWVAGGERGAEPRADLLLGGDRRRCAGEAPPSPAPAATPRGRARRAQAGT